MSSSPLQSHCYCRHPTLNWESQFNFLSLEQLSSLGWLSCHKTKGRQNRCMGNVNSGSAGNLKWRKLRKGEMECNANNHGEGLKPCPIRGKNSALLSKKWHIQGQREFVSRVSCFHLLWTFLTNPKLSYFQRELFPTHIYLLWPEYLMRHLRVATATQNKCIFFLKPCFKNSGHLENYLINRPMV